MLSYFVVPYINIVVYHLILPMLSIIVVALLITALLRLGQSRGTYYRIMITHVLRVRIPAFY